MRHQCACITPVFPNIFEYFLFPKGTSIEDVLLNRRRGNTGIPGLLFLNSGFAFDVYRMVKAICYQVISPKISNLMNHRSYPYPSQ